MERQAIARIEDSHSGSVTETDPVSLYKENDSECIEPCAQAKSKTSHLPPETVCFKYEVSIREIIRISLTKRKKKNSHNLKT